MKNTPGPGPQIQGDDMREQEYKNKINKDLKEKKQFLIDNGWSVSGAGHIVYNKVWVKASFVGAYTLKHAFIIEDTEQKNGKVRAEQNRDVVPPKTETTETKQSSGPSENKGSKKKKGKKSDKGD